MARGRTRFGRCVIRRAPRPLAESRRQERRRRRGRKELIASSVLPGQSSPTGASACTKDETSRWIIPAGSQRRRNRSSRAGGSSRTRTERRTEPPARARCPPVCARRADPSRVQASRALGLGARALPHAPARLEAPPARVRACFHRRIAGELLAGLLARLADFSAERAVAGAGIRPPPPHAFAHL